MKTRREFLATAVAGAASLAASSGQTRATPAGLSIVDEAGRRDRAFSDSGSGGRDMVDKGEDPRITRARLSGPEHVTKDATVAEIIYPIPDLPPRGDKYSQTSRSRWES